MAPDQHIVTGIAIEVVIAVAAEEQVVAVASVEGVVAFTALEPVMGGVPDEEVVACGAEQDHLLDGVDVPDGAVGEADFLDRVGGGCIVREVVADGDAVSGAAEREHEVVAAAGDEDVTGRDASPELDGIELVGRGVVAVDGVTAPTTLEAVDVIAGATVEDVVTLAPDQHIVTGIAIEVVIAVAAEEQVIAVASVEGVVAFTALEPVMGGVPDEEVVACGAEQDHLLDGVDVPDGAVGEADFLDRVGGGCIVREVVADGDAVSGAAEREHEVVAAAGDEDVTGRDASPELDGIELVGRAVVAVDGVTAPTTLEAVDVIAGATVEDVVTLAPDQHIVSAITVEIVVVVAAEEQVIAVASVEGVVALTTVEQVVAFLTVETIIPFATFQIVRPSVSVKGVLASLAKEEVGPVGAFDAAGRRSVKYHAASRSQLLAECFDLRRAQLANPTA